jgi:translation initiation factor 3 subunit E
MVQQPELPSAENRYDLTRKIVPFLDRHFVIPVLGFFQESGLYKKEQIMKAQVDLLAQTNMVDYAIDLHKELTGTEDEPSYLVDRRDEVLEEMEEMKGKVQQLLELIDDEPRYTEMKRLKVVSEITQQFDLEPDAIDSLFAYAKFQYQCGNYAMAGELLKHYRILTANDTQTGNTNKQLLALWGSLACCVLECEWEGAGELVLKLDEAYDSANLKIARYEVVLNRAWLLHWTLFIVFKADNPTVQKKLMEWFLQDKSLQTISIACTHLLRYVAALLILHKQLQDSRASELLNKIRQDRYWFSDPITQFLEALYFDIDFDAAQEQLNVCCKVLEADYFLSDLQQEFKDHCRELIFETYCRIHQHINLSMIAEKLGMGEDEAEIWIVKLIQQAKLDAKIDSETNRVLMARQAPNIYQQVLDRTKNVAFRTQLLNVKIEKNGLQPVH